MILVVIPHCPRRRAAGIWIDGFLVLFGEGQPGLPDPRPDCVLHVQHYGLLTFTKSHSQLIHKYIYYHYVNSPAFTFLALFWDLKKAKVWRKVSFYDGCPDY